MFDTVVISGEDVCCSVVFGTLVGVGCVLCYVVDDDISVVISDECHNVECAFTSPVRTECGMFVMCCMQWCMSVSAVL